MANLFDTGGGLPQTVTPFSMDLSAPIMAITQNMVKTRKQEISNNKAIADQNEAAMLKALDFETVKGLSDKIQEDHIKAVDDLTEKWAGRMATVQGKLTSADKLELTRDQRNMETDIANKKSNVLAFAELQKFIQTNPKAREILDVDATAKKMADWSDSGKIGESGAAFLAVPRQWSGGQIMMQDDGKLLEETAKRYNEEITGAAPGRVAEIRQTYGKRAEDLIKSVLANPRLDTPQKKEEAIGAANAVLGDITKDQYIRGWNPNSGSGNKEPKPNTMDFVNEMVVGLKAGNKSAMDIVRNTPGVGSFEYDEAKRTYAIRGTGDKDPVRYLALPESNDPVALQNFATTLLTYAPNIMLGKNVPAGWPSMVDPNYQPQSKFVPEQSPQIKFIDKLLSDPKGTSSDGEKSNKKSLTEQLKSDLGDTYKVDTGNWSWIGGKGTGTIIITDPDGNVHDFNTNTSKGKSDLKQYYLDNTEIGKAYKERRGGSQSSESKPEIVKQNGIEYKLNKTTGEYDPI